ncbi:UDP-N-acetylglucosamine 2-epimerase [Prochlorococcus marinus str. NATL1A]|uniref:UDP-N-acetylglucosamine 2-epimerase n=1 Tax=Prochlorococcus marinus (strain NATL1A) TaxID=167555 RepID=A2C1S1_PROM1|nr:UDP-N-acetylglucosamine 2-epimerase [Prochlorococcus marinus]ABM75431.1 UDP-N-acetylglucosamine 2-epimerase [Prochlorococcus marinus str. NATL1A]
MDKKVLLFVTGTRADFGKMEPLAREAFNNGFKVIFFVTGMHMMREYGLTKEEVHKNKDIQIFEFSNQKYGDKLDTILSNTVRGFSNYVKEINPDIVIIHGDRIEAIACSLVCSTNNIISAHIEGGEVSGTIDEVFRHCNTKLCTFHLVSSNEAKKRVRQMGEPEKNIFVIGSPELDIHGRKSGVDLLQVKERYKIDFKEYGICIFHPVTTEENQIKIQAENLFKSLSISNRNFVIILPNNDPGSIYICNEIDKLNSNNFRIIPSMRFNYFSELMKNSSLIIGNSSLGVREAPFLGIMSINIGTRQNKRALTQSIYNCSGQSIPEIVDAIGKFWNKKTTSHKGFGSGNSRKKFLKFINSDKIWNQSTQKSFEEL